MNLYRLITTSKIYNYLINKKSKRKANNLMPYINNNSKILDVGCGNLLIAREIVKLNKSVSITGIDVMALPEISDITEHPQISYIKASAEKIPFADKSFDISLCLVTLHHINNQSEVLKELSRVTKTKGFVIILEDGYSSRLGKLALIINDVLHNFFKPQPAFDFNFHSYNEWIELFKSSGLELNTFEKHMVHFNLMTQYQFILSPK